MGKHSGKNIRSQLVEVLNKQVIGVIDHVHKGGGRDIRSFFYFISYIFVGEFQYVPGGQFEDFILNQSKQYTLGKP